jgi:RNase adaptor protein for sRNA GlmZ degradation
VLRALAPNALRTRSDLQRFGSQVELDTQGEWLSQAVAAAKGAGGSIAVDSVRTRLQLECVSDVLQAAFHVHLHAQAPELERRYALRGEDDLEEPRTFAAAMTHRVELEVAEVADSADFVIDTTELQPEAVLAAVEVAVNAE